MNQMVPFTILVCPFMHSRRLFRGSGYGRVSRGSPQYAGMPNALTPDGAQAYTNTSSRTGRFF